jgi:hypothetical protein
MLPTIARARRLLKFAELNYNMNKNNAKIETQAAAQVWDNTSNPDYIKDMSHWRGCGRWADDMAWKAIGLKTLADIKFLLRMLNSSPSEEFKLNSILEWGPGGGANLYALAGVCSHYYGIDISTSNLEESMRMIRAEGYGHVYKPIHIKNEPSEVLTQGIEPLNLILSTAVFQHFPSKAYGEEVLNCMYKITAPGCLGVIQIRFDNGNPKYFPINGLGEYKKRHITATSYQIDEFWNILKKVGFNVVSIGGIAQKNNYCTYYFKKD